MSEHGDARRPEAGGRAAEAGGGPSVAKVPPSGAGGERDELYEELRAYEGRPAATSGRGKDPVNEPMIRHWCEATGHPVPPDGTAPATMLQVWTMAGLASGHARSRARDGEGPAARSSGASARAGTYDALLRALDSAGYTSVVATDCEQEYLRALRPGDTVDFDAVIESVSPRKTTKLGTGYFVTTRMDIRVDGETAGTHRFRILKYLPAHARRNDDPDADTASADTASAGAASAGTVSAGTADAGTVPDKAVSGAATDNAVADKEASQDASSRTSADTGPAGQGERPARRPRPVVNRDNAPFWEGVRAHELLIQRCDACGTPRFPWLPGCNACGSPEWTPFASAGRGAVYSYVVMHHPPFPAFDPPYAVALVELEEGIRIVSNIVGVPCEEVRIGMPVELEFLRVDDACELPVFRGTEAA